MKNNKKNKSLINAVKKGCNFFYRGMEYPFSLCRTDKFFKTYSNLNKKTDKLWLKQLIASNKIIKKIYKREELEIKDLENIKSCIFKSTDGVDLFGVVYQPHKDSNKWVIVSHWFAGHKTWALHHGLIFSKMGYNIFAYDFRGHGQSQPYQTTMGLLEKYDLLGALRWLKENYQIDSLALMGTSMGGFVTNYCSILYYEEFKKANLKLIISDSAYANIYNLFLHAKNTYLPFIPKNSTKKIIQKIINYENKKIDQLDYNELDIFELLKEKGNINLFPTLFIHSLNDKVTNPIDTYELLIRRFNKNDDYLICNFSMHTQAIRNHFKIFNYKIAEFINRFDKNEILFNKTVDEWKLKIIDKKDRRSLNLK